MSFIFLLHTDVKFFFVIFNMETILTIVYRVDGLNATAAQLNRT